jgi:hypothetical protein
MSGASDPGLAPREELVRPVRRALDWMLSLRGADGRLVCPEHRVEHTGKNAGAVVTALELARHADPEDAARLESVALDLGRRVAGRLEREGTSPCFTFRPGRHDPFNCSNSVIDGGAASDALGALARSLAGRRPERDLEPLSAASLLHARTYLRYAVLDKGIPAQRAWGLTGLASAWRCEQDPLLVEAALAAVEILAGIQRADGSYPYHPLEWGAEHPGSADASAFYQSRVTAFLLHALEDLGLDPLEERFAEQVTRGLDFLRALHGPDGLKVGLVEAKPWYWGATHEVASHPFDVAALAAGWRLSGDARLGAAALRAHRAWAAHLAEDGAPRSHVPGPGRGRSYQCPVFWAGHARWTARALGDLEAMQREGVEADEPWSGEPRAELFADASLVRLEDARVVAWVRGARPGVNVSHGSPHGAGLVRVVRRSDGRELLPRCRLGGHQQGEWSGLAGHTSLARGWRSGGREVRFSLWLARVHARAGRPLEALLAPPRMVRRGVLAFAHPRVSSAFALDPELRLEGAGARLVSGLAHRDGSPVPGTRLERRFRVDGGGLVVEEVGPEAAAVRGLEYRVPEGASEVLRSGPEIRYRLC